MKVLDQKSNFLGLEDKYSNFDDSKIILQQIPYEYTVSYGKGAKNGPSAIINASQYVEFYDIEFDKEICFENGIATIPELKFDDLKDKEALDLIKATTSKFLEKDKFVVSLGGEHTISSALIKSHLDKYPKMCVLQFDAHADLRDSYEGNKYSHASVMARTAEFFTPSKIHQVGIRALSQEEKDFIDKTGINTLYSRFIHNGTYGHNWKEDLVDKLENEIYVTFDVDYFDPSIMPSTGTPEPNGLLYNETLEIFKLIKLSGKRIIGLDVVELSPVKELHHCDITTASLIYKILGYNFS